MDPMQVHGFLILLFSLGLLCVLLNGYFAPEPPETRLESYYDDPSKVGIVVAMVWAVFAMFIGDWVAWLLAFPDLTFDAAWSSFGRSEEHKSELQSLMRISYAVFCLKKKNKNKHPDQGTAITTYN